MSCFRLFTFTFLLAFSAGDRKGAPPTIGRTCAFDAKIYKIVDTIFAVSLCVVWNKKIFKLFYFYFQLPTLLVDLLDKILPILTPKTIISLLHPERRRRIKDMSS